LFLAILAQNCGICHGRSDPNAPLVPLEFTDDIPRMLELGLIVPLRSDLSPIFQMMSDGSMPPPGVEPRPFASDVEVISQYIDNPRFWPDFVAPDVDAGSAVPTEEGSADAGL
jgi:hypothetical protein